ncbi:MAG: dUTP diphosphatase [Candidatus Tectomicrobia bacterium]|uniref:Deoxyuridine 5'-triphosphate nucleotidohydrolase n=1 Tax=Tectimicrobiota bacterium TaxID=2528274 RepID=A0A932FX76_UNCTE|nr:dUTP diphosphatase [Candidatus Tectomicrobia bacterium]
MERKLTVEIRVEEGCEDLPLPSYRTAGAAGMDLHAAVTGEEVLSPGEWKQISCGIAIALPPGYEAQVRPRSGLALQHGITLLNSPGTIDADYRGTIGVILINHGPQPFTLRRGDRIAQLVVGPVAQVTWNRVPTLSDSERGRGGFGHTGK